MRRRRLTVVILAVALFAVLAGGVFLLQRKTESPEEPALASKPQAPPDLEKFRDAFTAGIAALKRDDGAEAVKQLASFDFGPRAVEQYRLYHLANGHRLAGNAPAARATLAKLWRRKPAMVVYPDAALQLGNLYAAGDDWDHAADVYASLAHRADPPVAGTARWNLVEARFVDGDPAAMFDAARALTVHSPRAPNADDAIAVFRALTSVPDGQALKLTHLERLERAKNLMRDGDAKAALAELETLRPVAPATMRMEIDLQRGLALRANGRFEDSVKVLEPLTSGPFKYAIPSLRAAAQNYRVVSDSINPVVIKIVKEKKKVGTVKVRTGKGKKRRTVTKPKYAIVPKQIKLVDLAKKTKKDEYDRLATERLKDLLQLEEVEPDLRLEVLNALIARAIAKNQTDYIQGLVPQVIKLDSVADPALQYLWDKAWAAFARGDLNGARPLFRYIADTYTHPNARRQSEYWYARTVERLGAKDEAKAIYRKLAGAPYEDLYAIHATSRGAQEVEPKTNPLQVERPDWEQVAEKDMPSELRLAYELTALQQPAAA
ncbi:MAG TPA: hypothetical protein VN181_09715, partial [Thermoanaerobaculia bacterium]|nr:hypothetical protein [Thermoanaerobaculia bacterium]